MILHFEITDENFEILKKALTVYYVDFDAALKGRNHNIDTMYAYSILTARRSLGLINDFDQCCKMCDGILTPKPEK
jgi:hypothetical protein